MTDKSKLKLFAKNDLQIHQPLRTGDVQYRIQRNDELYEIYNDIGVDLRFSELRDTGV